MEEERLPGRGTGALTHLLGQGSRRRALLQRELRQRLHHHARRRLPPRDHVRRAGPHHDGRRGHAHRPGRVLHLLAAALHRLRAVQGLLRRGGREPDGPALPVPGGGAQVPGDPGARGAGATCTTSRSAITARRPSAAPRCGCSGWAWPDRWPTRSTATSPTGRTSSTPSGRRAGAWACRSWARSPTCSTTPRTAFPRPTTTSPIPGTRTRASRPTWTPAPAPVG